MRSYIESEIARKGPIPFSRFMQLCLYGEPGSPPGFYTRKKEQFGKTGDFYTSSDVHAVYGRLLARQFAQMWQTMGSPESLTIIELGPGRGLFAVDVLAWVKRKFPEFYRALTYSLVETSASLRERLHQRFEPELEPRTANHGSRVTIHDSLDSSFQASSESVIVFGNEFFDALPTEVLDYRGELRIDVEGGRFVERFVPATTSVAEFVTKYAVQPDQHERVDAPLAAQETVLNIAAAMKQKRGYCVFVDYGYVQGEMFAGRHLGTVTSFRKHTVSDSSYQAPGEQDITVHVNFTALADAARQQGLEPLAWVSQSQFLMGVGEESQFAEAFEDCKLPQEHAKRALQLKHLITPEGMGESFHVLVIAANLKKEKAAQIDGLKFVRLSNQI
jgi:SAM-dependent MidA family methyltransferase